MQRMVVVSGGEKRVCGSVLLSNGSPRAKPAGACRRQVRRWRRRVDRRSGGPRKNSASIRERFSGHQHAQEERVSTDHTDSGPLEGLIPPELLLTMNGGEPAIVCLRVEHLDATRGFGFDVGDDPTFSTSVARFGGGRLRVGDGTEGFGEGRPFRHVGQSIDRVRGFRGRRACPEQFPVRYGRRYWRRCGRPVQSSPRSRIRSLSLLQNGSPR